MKDLRPLISQLNKKERIRLYIKIKWLQKVRNRVFTTGFILFGRFLLIMLATIPTWNKAETPFAFAAMCFGAYALALISVQYQKLFRRNL